MPDVLFILLLALMIFGPKKLPEIARQVAKLMAQFRVMRDDLKQQLDRELLNIELEEKQKTTAMPPASLSDPAPDNPPEALPRTPPAP